MRDPDGRIRVDGDTIIRRLNSSADASHFLHCDLAARWASRGDLVTWEWLTPDTLRSPKLPFVSLPSEWTALQFHAAAQLTLTLQAEAVAEGWDMKDASAWNIVFDGLRPVFVDLLSFKPLETRRWHAAGQFGRHFILPLLLAKRGLLQAHECLTLWRDGVPATAARRMLGPSRFLTRYWPLMAAGRHAGGGETFSGGASDTRSPDWQDNLANKQSFRNRLNRGLGWMLQGVCPGERTTKIQTEWGDYEQQRDHYSPAEIASKVETITLWMQSANPQWVLDLGCNAGEFSDLAVDTGARVICWDGDPKALAKLYQRHHESRNATSYHPILGPIDDISGGRGWEGSEFPSLMQRLNQRVDVVLMLAIVHHLSIAGGVPLEDIFRFAAHVTRRALFVEFLSESDTRVQQMCRYYNRDVSDFTRMRQLEAARSAGFHVVERKKHQAADTRELVWLEHAPG